MPGLGPGCCCGDKPPPTGMCACTNIPSPKTIRVTSAGIYAGTLTWDAVAGRYVQTNPALPAGRFVPYFDPKTCCYWAVSTVSYCYNPAFGPPNCTPGSFTILLQNLPTGTFVTLTQTS